MTQTFETMQIDLDPAQVNNLVEAYIGTTFFPESFDLFEELIRDETSFETALYKAMVNDVLIRVLQQATIHHSVINEEKTDD